MVRHFLDIHRLEAADLRAILDDAHARKAARKGWPKGRTDADAPAKDRVLAMIFEKNSTRTRFSFDAAIRQLGGASIIANAGDMQLGRGEPVEDTARVLSRMVDAVMIRTFSHETLERFAAHSRVPVINGLSDMAHPCQLLADMQTYLEHRGDIRGRRVAWIGDGNNVCNSYINASRVFDYQLVIACPEGFEPNATVLAAAGDRCKVVRDPQEAAAGADLIATDVWASMGQEEEQRARAIAFADYQVNEDLMAEAAPDALFMHCLPAHRGEEVSAAVIDGPQSVVWDEAENRLHAQKALLELLLLPSV